MPVEKKNAHFFKHHPNSTRTHRTPSKTKKEQIQHCSQTPHCSRSQTSAPICLAPLYANPTTAPTTPPNTRNFNKNTPRDIHLPRTLISKTKDHANNAAKRQPLQKHVPRNHHTPRSFISKNQRPCQKCSKRSILFKE